ncbi:3-oxoacyl-[acyl-carrier-protein] synthase III C-terminal domain-containing protein [Mycobacterium riyadhense]|uniref:3-oxoacyl-[acyl-carrier-protein] synthase 3 n=1 Tax=Mycobacterium riyadhense TaxID=486698 RepID=A0A1X2CDM4_9MYCO|nr:3-oxoacyl-[acyl-carrier-protein] synthase III C-terminal domain-containing protein [Mycobacterium riyadhense]ORW74125.1 hypothetical protein AWC22_23690 [Mycobacterium riyadhense]
MVAAYVDSFVYSLGERKCDVRDSAAAGKLVSSAEDLESAGFRWHHVCETSTGPYDLAKAVTTELADTVGLADIDAIIYPTCLPVNGNVGSQKMWERTGDVKHLMDFPASRLQADFGLDGAVVIGLNQQGCTGMLGSIRLATTMLAAEEQWRRVLCVTADRFPETARYEQAYNLISDSAAACIVKREPRGFRYVGAHQITNGGLVDADDDETVGTFFTYTHRVITETLTRNGLRIDDVAWIVTQNTNDKAWQVLARFLGVDIAKVCFSSLADVGHAISADQVINLVELIGSGRIRPGELLALVVAGSGLTYQCVILEATTEFA